VLKPRLKNQFFLMPLSIAAFPLWLVWVGVIPLCAGLGAWAGNGLDICSVSVPAGLGTDWTKLLGFLLGAVGLGIFLGVLLFS
jgi:hypothetical protein